MSIKSIKISDNFSYSRLMLFTVPSIMMMIITSVYVVVDGIFVSNFVGESAFASLNLIFPVLTILSAFGFMLGTGGCALVGKYLGEGKKEKANEVFSMIIFVVAILSASLAAVGIVFIEPLAYLLGATPDLVADCVTYGTIMLIALPGFMLQVTFQTFVVVANKPSMGMVLSILSGVINIILDYLFMVVFEWGIAGAAAATGASQAVGGIVPLFYFLRKNNTSNLVLTKFKWHFKALIKSCSNGISEMMTSISASVVNVLYNLQLMHYIGAEGVSAYGIVLYITFIFAGVFIGYTIGVSPVVSYHYGAENTQELKSLLKKSIVLMVSSSVVLTLLAELFARPLASIFVSYDADLMALSIKALRLYSISFLFSCINIFASAFFTALNNGKVSAFISFLRTFVLQAVMILLLPYLFGIDGIWLAVVFAELICLVVTLFLFKRNKRHYQY